jgi:OOP family OmpA-OmpF porin
MGNFMAGVTGQIKLSDRFALTGDFNYHNAKQNVAFDGEMSLLVQEDLVDSFNGTVGVTVY